MTLMIFSLFLMPHAFAGLPSGVPFPVKCESSILAELQNENVAGSWRRQVDPDSDTLNFRSPTTKFGKWVELHVSKKGTATLFTLENGKAKSVVWDGTCAQTHSTSADNSPTCPNCFTDAELNKMVTEKRSALIYAWSPGMVYSVDSLKTVAALAKEMKYEFIPVLDRFSELRVAGEAIKARRVSAKLQQHRSIELAMRSIDTHHPTIVIVHDGKIYDDVVVGVHTPDTWKAEIQMIVNGASKQ